MKLYIEGFEYDSNEIIEDMAPLIATSRMFGRSEKSFRAACKEMKIPIISIRASLTKTGPNVNNYFVKRSLFMQRIEEASQVKEQVVKSKTIGELSINSWSKRTTAQTYIKKENHYEYLEKSKPPMAGCIILLLNIMGYTYNAKLKTPHFDYSRLKAAAEISSNLPSANVALYEYLKTYNSSLIDQMGKAIQQKRVYELYKEKCASAGMTPIDITKFEKEFNSVIGLIAQDAIKWTNSEKDINSVIGLIAQDPIKWPNSEKDIK